MPHRRERNLGAQASCLQRFRKRFNTFRPESEFEIYETLFEGAAHTLQTKDACTPD